MQWVLEPLDTVFRLHEIESLVGTSFETLVFRPTKPEPAIGDAKIPADISEAGFGG